MHGTNPVRKRERTPGELQVQDIFLTVQGEGPYAGHPAVFVRLSGCNLRCFFCDTAWDDEKDKYLSIDEIVANIIRVAGLAELVVLTGGEPTRQDLSGLIRKLRWEQRFRVQIETAGTFWQNCLHDVDIVVSPKTPKIQPMIKKHAIAFKYVIRAGELEGDGLPGGGTQVRGSVSVLARPRDGAPVYLSPCDEGNPERNALNLQAAVASAMEHNYIAGIQMHKLMGVR